ncbi:OLC1v1030097C1 [Oldenlandia corymbosa var. corymbosa]|uniref:OLC1v1030097C1 n=1 Tax=Oldenlandia corymbosa var. corymbosa TaxID=529605 RepID=A0AAV1CG19_OLDCO|nr:OLC1v1030097C1 [Oldenlandia corymbosa var. corymbosa]
MVILLHASAARISGNEIDRLALLDFKHLGPHLPNLQEFEFYGNQFTGNIPASVSNMSKLWILEVSSNNLQGRVLNGLGNFPDLEVFNIEADSLGSDSPGELNFIESLTNCSDLNELAFGEHNFGGKLPNAIGNLSSQLTEVYMDLNHVSVPIHVGFGKLVYLLVLNLTQNLFTGVILSDLLELRNLQHLSLSQNLLSGEYIVIEYRKKDRFKESSAGMSIESGD